MDRIQIVVWCEHYGSDPGQDPVAGFCRYGDEPTCYFRKSRKLDPILATSIV
jgi:hypothetical protein